MCEVMHPDLEQTTLISELAALTVFLPFSLHAMIISIHSERMNNNTGCLTIYRHLWTLHEGCKVYHISCQL